MLKVRLGGWAADDAWSVLLILPVPVPVVAVVVVVVDVDDGDSGHDVFRVPGTISCAEASALHASPVRWKSGDLRHLECLAESGGHWQNMGISPDLTSTNDGFMRIQ